MTGYVVPEPGGNPLAGRQSFRRIGSEAALMAGGAGVDMFLVIYLLQPRFVGPRELIAREGEQFPMGEFWRSRVIPV